MSTHTAQTPTGTTSSETASPATLVERAARLGPQLAENAARHDRDGTFVADSYAALHDAGLLRAAVPVELGGDGATVAELAALQREIAHHCGATALASAMHQHVTAFTAWRYRRGLPGAEATLRKVADQGLVLLSTGGGDYTHPAGSAVEVDGGYVVSGHKRFASQAPVAGAIATMFVHEDPEQGRRVLNMAVPMSAEGVAVLPTWDTLGMRGTASHDLLFDEVFVPDAQVLANRPYGVVDGPLMVISSIAFPVISAAYLGVAEAAYEAARQSAAARSESTVVQRQVGVMRHRLAVASWALDGALAAVGPDPTPDVDVTLAVMTAKREVAEASVAVCDLAMEVAGGSAYFTGSVVERAYRDVRAVKFHPLTPEDTLVESGRRALGVPGVFAG
jgi:alkylation response protein AidB-like acyl-CoA dehydrogenase